MQLNYEITISPASGGFGEYQSDPIDGEGWADSDDLLNQISSNGVDAVELIDGVVLPAGLEDIRGRIHNEPQRVFGFIGPDGDPCYFGIVVK